MATKKKGHGDAAKGMSKGTAPAKVGAGAAAKAKAKAKAKAEADSGSGTRARAKPSTRSLAQLGAVVGSEQAFERFRVEAGTLTEPVQVCRADVRLAHFNVKRAADSILGRREQVAAELPAVAIEDVERAPELALALVFAASRAAQAGGIDEGGVGAKLGRARQLRGLMLSSAETLVHARLLPERAVQKIREGRGSLDAAQDAVDLSALFRANAGKLRGKTPVTAADVDEAATLGTELLSMLKPKGARSSKKAATGVAEATAVRDRLWTMLMKRHEELRRVGVWLWGEAEVDAHVPLLQSRAASARRGKGQGVGAEGEGGGEAQGGP